MAHSKLPDERSKKQSQLIRDLRKKEHWMKWVIGAAIVIILLLLLFLGYATDWTRGLYKNDGSTTPVSSALDSQTTEGVAPTSGSGVSGGGSGASSSSGDTNSAISQNKETSERVQTNTVTNNNSTSEKTTTTNTNTTTPSEPSQGLLSLYSDTLVGENIEEILNRAESLGLQGNCTQDLLVKVCVFEQNGQLVTVKSLLLNGAVSSVTTNF